MNLFIYILIFVSSFSLYSGTGPNFIGMGGLEGTLNIEEIDYNMLINSDSDSDSLENLVKLMSAQDLIKQYENANFDSYDCNDSDDCKGYKAYLTKLTTYNKKVANYYTAVANGENPDALNLSEPSYTGSCEGDCATLQAKANSISSSTSLTAQDLRKKIYKNFKNCTKRKKKNVSTACQESINAYLAHLAKNGASAKVNMATMNYEGPKMCTKTDNIFKGVVTGGSLLGAACNGVTGLAYTKGKLDLSNAKNLKYCLMCNIANALGGAGKALNDICSKVLNATEFKLMQRRKQIFASKQTTINSPGQFPTGQGPVYANMLPPMNTSNMPTTVPSLPTTAGTQEYNTAGSRVGGTGNAYNSYNNNVSAYGAATNSLSNYATLSSARNHAGVFSSPSELTSGTDGIFTRGSGRGDGTTDSITKINKYLDIVQDKVKLETKLKEEINPALFNTCFVGGNTAMASYMLNPTGAKSQAILTNKMDCWETNLSKAIVVGDIVTVNNAMLCRKFRKECADNYILVSDETTELVYNPVGLNFASLIDRFAMFASLGTSALSSRLYNKKTNKLLNFKKKKYKIHSWKDVIRARVSYLKYMWTEYTRTLNIAKAKAKLALKRKLPMLKQIPSPRLLAAQLKYVKDLKTKSKKSSKVLSNLIRINKRKLLSLNKSSKKYKLLEKSLTNQKRLNFAVNKAYKIARQYKPVYQKTFDNIYESKKNYNNYWYLRKKLLGKYR